MDLVPYLSAVILIATIATLLLAVFSFAAFKLRNGRKPKVAEEKPVFFHRFRLEPEAPAGGSEDPAQAAAPARAGADGDAA